MNVTNLRCRKRGCRIVNGNIYFLWDREDDTDNNGTRNDIPTLLPMVNLSLDKELEKKGQMEKMDIASIRIMQYLYVALYIMCSKYSITDKV
jgi:hypothetical protein